MFRKRDTIQKSFLNRQSNEKGKIVERFDKSERNDIKNCATSMFLLLHIFPILLRINKIHSSFEFEISFFQRRD